MTREQHDKWSRLVQRQRELLGLLEGEAVMDDSAFAKAFIREAQIGFEKFSRRLALEPIESVDGGLVCSGAWSPAPGLVVAGGLAKGS